MTLQSDSTKNPADSLSAQNRAAVIDGRALARQARAALLEKVKQLPSAPRLAIIRAGTNEASKIYVRNKQKAAAETGITVDLYEFDSMVCQETLANLITKLNNDSMVNGIIIQLPLPPQLDEAALLQSISPAKDVDGFHPLNSGLLQNNSPAAVIPATPKGIMRLLQSSGVDLNGKNALVIGRSQIVGKPVAMLLLNQNATVTIAHSRSQNLPALVGNADIVVAACGCPRLIKGGWLKKGAVIIDVGINRTSEGICGDVDFQDALPYAGSITPVPGGVGPMTIAMLLENTYDAYLKQNGKS